MSKEKDFDIKSFLFILEFLPFRDPNKYNRKINTIIDYTCLNVALSLKVIATYESIYFITVGAFRQSTKVFTQFRVFFYAATIYMREEIPY